MTFILMKDYITAVHLFIINYNKLWVFYLLKFSTEKQRSGRALSKAFTKSI